MATASDTGNPPRPLAPRLRVGDEIPVFSLPNTSGVSVSSTVLLEPGSFDHHVLPGALVPLLPQRSDDACECHVSGAVARRIAGGDRAGNGAEQPSQISAATQGRFPDPERCHRGRRLLLRHRLDRGLPALPLQSVRRRPHRGFAGAKLDRADAGTLRRRARRHDRLCRHQHRLSGGTRTGCGNGSATSPLDATAHGNGSSDTNGPD